MTKEEILKSFLSDDLLVEQKQLKPGESDNVKWSDKDASKLVTVIKLTIEGEASAEGNNVTIRKINQLLNSDK
jgi:hypothetical protein